jgi:hypothetical protein
MLSNNILSDYILRMKMLIAVDQHEQESVILGLWLHSVWRLTVFTKNLSIFLCMVQYQIKGFVSPRHFSSQGPFGDSKNIVRTIVYSRLYGLMEGDARIIEKHG